VPIVTPNLGFFLQIEGAYQIWHNNSGMRGIVLNAEEVRVGRQLPMRWYDGTRRSRAMFWNRYLLERQWYQAGMTSRRYWPSGPKRKTAQH